jgi:hypothetical protein
MSCGGYTTPSVGTSAVLSQEQLTKGARHQRQRISSVRSRSLIHVIYLGLACIGCSPAISAQRRRAALVQESGQHSLLFQKVINVLAARATGDRDAFSDLTVGFSRRFIDLNSDRKEFLNTNIHYLYDIYV